MFLFIISFLLVFLSSYFITSILAPKKNILGLIYLFLVAFAQIVLTFEVLSLFSAIKEHWVLAINVLVLTLSTYLWNKNSRPIWSLNYAEFKNRFINSLNLDKSLMWLYVGFCTLLLSAFILCLLLPTTSADARSYHVARSIFWVLQGSLNHFDIADIRNLCLPINSEILYTWVILFLKKDVFLCFFSFVGYIISIVSVYNILGLLGYCTRKKLWAIFVLSSFSSVIVQVSGNETDIIVAGLVSSSIFMFWYALKNDKKIPLFMSSLAYALAIGTKTTALIALPGVGLFLLGLCIYFKKYKDLTIFLGFGLANFLIFASYNYILNYIEFGNFISSKSFLIVSKNYFGIKGTISNFIKYIFMFFDFTGFRWGEYITPAMINIRNSVLSFLHLGYIKDGIYTTPYFANFLLLEPIMGAGILGFLVYLPCLIWSLVKPITKNKNRKTLFLSAFALLFIINIIFISSLLAYMSFSARFVMFFMVISSPILVYSYFSKRNPLKYIIIAFSLFYLMFVSNYLWARPLFRINRILVENPSISALRDRAECKDFRKYAQYSNTTCLLRKIIVKRLQPKNRILAFLSTSDNIYSLKVLEFQGYKIDIRRMEDAKNINFKDYNVIISTNKGQTATLITDYENRKNECRISGNKIIIKNNDSIPCLYIQNPKIAQMKNAEVKYPCQVRCGMTKSFIEKNKLSLIGRVGLMNSTVPEYDYYTIYANTTKPLFLKK